MYAGCRLVLFAAAIVLSGCANISPKLLKDGKSEGQEAGLRYYETRPFVVVKEPYPIGSSAFLVSGRVSGDGKTVLITTLPDELRRLAPVALETGARIPASRVLVASAAEQDQLKAHGADGNDEDSSKKPDTGKPSDDKDKEADSGDKPPTTRKGFSNIAVTTDITALARFELSKSISLIFLPDYEREFVVDTKSKLGTTRLTLNLGPGSSLLGMSGEVDNSVVVTALLDSTTTLLTGGTDRLLGVITGAGKAAATGGGLTAHGAPGALAELAGQPVTLRAHLVKFAAIGMYPIVKPNEVERYHAPEQAYQTQRKFMLPVASHQIPYDYYEVLLFEHVLGGLPEGFIVNSAPNERSVTTDCTGKLKPANVDDWWDGEVAGMPDGADKARMQQLEVVLKPAGGGTECYEAADIRIKATSGSPAVTEGDRSKVEAAFRKKFARTTVKVVIGS